MTIRKDTLINRTWYMLRYLQRRQLDRLQLSKLKYSSSKNKVQKTNSEYWFATGSYAYMTLGFRSSLL